jgi:cadmium resistance protein CadD (predicted permease)
VIPDWLRSTLVGAVVFATTDVDDLVVLTAFFASPALRARSIVAGQFVGIAVLLSASAAIAWAAIAVPDEYVALLGFIPLGLGIAKLIELRRQDDDDEEAEAAELESRRQRSLHSQTLAVAAVTIANGGDNLGVYIPLLARDPDLVWLYAAVFAAMTGLWCLLAYWLVQHRVIGERVRRYGHLVLPLVLIALGLWILWDARGLIVPT